MSETGARAGAPAGARARKIRWLKRLVVVACFLPALRIAVGLATDRLGPNPIAELLNRLGFWTLVLLMATLTATPLRILSGWTWPIALRKTLGLAAFSYAAAHFVSYVAVDQFFDFREIFEDLAKRKFITVGFVAFALLIPLAVTSTSGMLKRLGARRWKRLHRLIYVAAGLGVVHFAWRVKSDYRQPIIFTVVLAVLFGIRLVDFAWRRARRPATALGAR